MPGVIQSGYKIVPHRRGRYEAMHRRYNPLRQRFDQPDPSDGSYDLADPQSFNRYAYTNNDPVNFSDPTGLLRPEDELAKLFAPVKTRNPWRWLGYRTKEGDSALEIEYELGKRQRRHGTFGTWSRLDTVDDLIRAWCGKTPD